MSFRRVVSLLLLAAYLPACTSFRPAPEPLSTLNTEANPVQQVRVTTNDGAQVAVDAPRVANDTLHGSTWTTESGGKQAARAVAIPLTDIRTVEVRKSDGTKTLLLVGGILVGITILGVAGSCGSYTGC